MQTPRTIEESDYFHNDPIIDNEFDDGEFDTNLDIILHDIIEVIHCDEVFD